MISVEQKPIVLNSVRFLCLGEYQSKYSMQALILAGGKGTRLKPLTLCTPKSIVPIGNKPFILRQISSLKKAGITNIILSLNYHPSCIEHILGDGADFDVDLKYVIEPNPLGTAGAYKYAEKFIDMTTIVLNGDILTDIDLGRVVDSHRKNGASATIVLTKVDDPSAYGLVEIGDDRKVLSFTEKPEAKTLTNPVVNTINAGIYILEPSVLDLIPEAENYSFENQLFPSLLETEQAFYGCVVEDYWIDIGTPQRYLQAHYDLIRGKCGNFQIDRGNDLHIGKDVEVDEVSLLGNGCVVGDGAKIVNSVLGQNVVVGKGSIIENSVVWDETTLSSFVKISGSILGGSCCIGTNVKLDSGSVLGDSTILGGSV